jgi:hypothetical protein
MKTTTTSVRLSGTGHKHQENNFKRLSKRILIHFGILVSMISNPVFANNLSYELPKIKVVSESLDNPLKKPALVSESDTIAIITTSYIKSIEEAIAEDNKIIESAMEDNATSDIERRINEDNQIIESNITYEVYPLDFKNLNRSLSSLN